MSCGNSSPVFSQGFIIIRSPYQSNESGAMVVPTTKSCNENLDPDSEPLRCKRRSDMNKITGVKTQTGSVMRRNERERNRVKHINKTFTVLRSHLPNGQNNKKMSKVETLKRAIDYIRYMEDLLTETGNNFLSGQVQTDLSSGVPSSMNYSAKIQVHPSMGSSHVEEQSFFPQNLQNPVTTPNQARTPGLMPPMYYTCTSPEGYQQENVPATPNSPANSISSVLSSDYSSQVSDSSAEDLMNMDETDLVDFANLF
ncbi:achaete-scute homolog 1 [Lingula anatina]|uniref:Achaete-scute homolog 1 n=1 Tax=Lingula anatina TaxID=7574 RepID=A0A2R2MID7_LINAN|nr:achaete-scute homolog 1 [Lingula anatina]|eukprot:XP_023929973.1 achaete-scute homolog 1 [Lingula anatina]